ncbi:O-acetyl-ADP-ribose deacetylase (regulator of RNase III)/diadenosine tetraphosphatase ApaH/serine/threonine PP2A family protein phosphatase [Allocatelliglobosispora scoriae]|uniref:O-acetyl-ADP-ribose deacetylase (Regulator of RNase III)/diadenosine tetraphosphatase ApaH/serine/threonine PP2A family protein phosphatase n=1 Tax=Allocatelliglobosispora scoriae TaxID=643052 RepID=A0A841C332_9ACTN|nr:toll/interleukin-1 receptor domain-containing protein [Allocatelliglobosispora scoriae]MBB5873452.1 O-acetyl-ADP-ribose deacetylase (regulator of RNase III)/diadenosine tetraphosphatase ApaH/serine/threonine PP2A family protein phosphatase [Allocatelliglobosispora scoriae]
MPRVFINFRGRDQPGFAALLDRDLSEAFGRDAVFLSSRSIRPGDDFVTQIHDSLRSCVALLAVIGPDWLRHSRPDPNDDWVRREIAEAFAQGLRVVPILVEDATLPPADQLPDDIAALVRCQYLRVHHRNIDHDLARVRSEVAAIIAAPIAPGDGAEAPADEVRVFDVAASACRVGVVSGSIRHVRFADIWVNSENTDMEMSRTSESTISGIIRYFGAERDSIGVVTEDVIPRALAAVVGARRPVAPCQAFVTTSGALARSHGVRHLIHVASVSGAPGAGFQQVPRIAGCVANALAAAERLAAAEPEVRSILLPLLGTGDGGGGLRATVTAMVGAVRAHLVATPDTALNMVYLLGYSNRERRVLLDELGSTGRPVPA